MGSIVPAFYIELLILPTLALSYSISYAPSYSSYQSQVPSTEVISKGYDTDLYSAYSPLSFEGTQSIYGLPASLYAPATVSGLRFQSQLVDFPVDEGPLDTLTAILIALTEAAIKQCGKWCRLPYSPIRLGSFSRRHPVLRVLRSLLRSGHDKDTAGSPLIRLLSSEILK